MTVENDAPASGGDDLHAELTAAFAADTPEPAVEPVIEPEVPAEPEPVVEPEAVDTRTASERARDEKGRFAPKTDAAPAEVKPVEAKPAEQAKPLTQDRIDPPPVWKGAAKTRWESLPRPVQQEIAARESQIAEMERGFSGIAQVLAPRAQRLAATYGSPEQGLNTLFQLSDFAERDPAGFVQFFIQQRRIDPSRLFPQPSGQQPPQGAAPNDATGLQAKINQLEQKLQAFTSQQTQASEQTIYSQIEQFSRSPEYPYFNDVREDMAALLAGNRATDLKDAYDKAVWANPNVRQAVLDAEREKADAERKAKADAARKAQQANINGSAAIGLTPVGNHPDDIRAELVSNYNQAVGRV